MPWESLHDVDDVARTAVEDALHDGAERKRPLLASRALSNAVNLHDVDGRG
jgi:hypothetical protein